MSRAEYIFDAGPDLLTESIVNGDANEVFKSRYLAGRATLAPVVEDLDRIGFKVNNPSDLVRAGAIAEPALKTLMDWFRRSSDMGIRVDILAVLGEPWAYEHTFDFLVEEFRRFGFPGVDENNETQWSTGGVIARLAKDDDFGVVIELAAEARYGVARSLLLYELGRFKRERTAIEPVLFQALDASELEIGSAAHAFGELRALAARERIQLLLSSPNEWLRSEAKKALRKLDTAERRAARAR